MTTARLTIDLGALAHNYAVLRAEAAGAEVAPVVKADGYGLGAGVLSRRLWQEGARAFFVARLSEGEALRAELAGRDAEIFVLDGLSDAEAAAACAAQRLTPVLNSLDQIRAWAALRGGRAALHIDTGMNRLGLDVAEAAEAARLFAQSPGVSLGLVMSHLSYAAAPEHPRNRQQLDRFRAALRHLPGARTSLAASAGAFLGPDYRFDMVRPGISLFGGGPREVPDPRLQAVAILEAPILQIRTVEAGESLGYGSMCTASRAMRVGVVAAGYADGVIRGSFATGRAMIDGRPAPLLIVSMDLIAIDLDDHPDVGAGTMVELLGPHALLDDVAAAAGTVAHECLVRLSARAERVLRD